MNDTTVKYWLPPSVVSDVLNQGDLTDEEVVHECLLYLCRRANRQYHIICDSERFVGVPALAMLDLCVRNDSSSHLGEGLASASNLDGAADHIASLADKLAHAMPEATRAGGEWIGPGQIEDALSECNIANECLLWTEQQECLHYIVRREQVQKFCLDGVVGVCQGGVTLDVKLVPREKIEFWPAIPTLEYYLQTNHDTQIPQKWIERIGEEALPKMSQYGSRQVVRACLNLYKALDADKTWVVT